MKEVLPTSERDLWLAELAFIGQCDDALLRSAQFAIRTAVRAQELARVAMTNPIDELLDARAQVHSDAARKVFETAINYLSIDQRLTRDPSIQRSCH